MEYGIWKIKLDCVLDLNWIELFIFLDILFLIDLSFYIFELILQLKRYKTKKINLFIRLTTIFCFNFITQYFTYFSRHLINFL